VDKKQSKTAQWHEAVVWSCLFQRAKIPHSTNAVGDLCRLQGETNETEEMRKAVKARPRNGTRAICEIIFRQEKAQSRRNPDGFQGFATQSWRKISAKRRRCYCVVLPYG
jgi:hypothetical protein